MPATDDAVIRKRLREALIRLDLPERPEPALVRRLRTLGFTSRQIVDILDAIAETSPELPRQARSR